MANNRYFMLCPCGSTHYVGKSLGQGMYYSTRTADENQEAMHEWMWEHLMKCPHPEVEPETILGPEWVEGEVFKVVTEYDKRVTATSENRKP